MTPEPVSGASLVAEAESYRGELTAYCYRFFASYAEAEDAVQETLFRAWGGGAGFEGRSSVRRWLYAIASHVCLDMAKACQRRSLPTDLHSPGSVPATGDALDRGDEAVWVSPVADHLLSDDPADAAVQVESVRLAFLVALQSLPPRQRVVLILRDVLAWSAAECAELLDSSAASVNSALARARTTLRHRQEQVPAEDSGVDRRVLGAYVAAFSAYDVDRLVGLLAEDARFSMPPYTLWLEGREDIEQWWRGPGQVCRNSEVLLTGVNRQPAVAVFHDGAPFAVHVLGTRDGRITSITHFMGTRFFEDLRLDR
ncbi:RNA polymerase subunit sigma-70 [Corynebacterium variabile]|uniref:RNA polymerase subunit sigma-70 n=1 Tax=Corynebacterium variabile TaxID=1727 RepID=UPI001D35681C|nr:RNA polymerase subunit sigma-70 [Corynebacterium variabile]HJG45877.1 RNA polymerase subunit sigma-70 [Corynebacterium variabile]